MKANHIIAYAYMVLAASMLITSNTQAQFHKREESGSGTQNPPPSNVDMRKWRYGEMDARDPMVWGRSIFHPNGNYTESKLDEGQRTLEQLTYRKKSQDQDTPVLLQKRLIKLNAAGRPTEVLIYDSAGRLTNRGTLFYDQLGRLTEERVFDTNNQLVRRNIQAYEENGQKMPLRTFNYSKDLTDDLDLLITPESVQKGESASENTPNKKSFLKKLQFWKKKDKQ